VEEPAGRPRLERERMVTVPTTDGPEVSEPPVADDAALAALYDASRAALLRLALLLTDDLAAAEDVVQDAFLGLRGRWAAVDPSSRGAYLRVAVVNGTRSLHRRLGTARRFLRVGEPAAAPADLAVLLADEHRRVVAALRTLPRRQREVLVLRYWSDLSEAAIAETLGVSRGTVKSTAARGLAALERKLGNSREH
jgi:RNA polymerase sigma-70 factor (sigma-E family)